MKNITICGNCGRDAELRQTSSGENVTNFTVGVTDRRNDNTTWFDVSIWGKRAEALTPYIRKGDKITVNGDLIRHEHNDQVYLKINCNEIELQGRKSSDIQDQADQMPEDDGADQIPF